MKRIILGLLMATSLVSSCQTVAFADTWDDLDNEIRQNAETAARIRESRAAQRQADAIQVMARRKPWYESSSIIIAGGLIGGGIVVGAVLLSVIGRKRSP